MPFLFVSKWFSLDTPGILFNIYNYKNVTNSTNTDASPRHQALCHKADYIIFSYLSHLKPSLMEDVRVIIPIYSHVSIQDLGF